jgi:hypothetical protein
LGWLIDPEEESILVVFPEQRVQLLRGTAQLPILREIGLELTVEQVFGWLKLPLTIQILLMSSLESSPWLIGRQNACLIKLDDRLDGKFLILSLR